MKCNPGKAEAYKKKKEKEEQDKKKEKTMVGGGGYAQAKINTRNNKIH